VKVNFDLRSTLAMYGGVIPSTREASLWCTHPGGTRAGGGGMWGPEGWWTAPQGGRQRLTLLRTLGPHGGDAGVQHVVDGRVAVEAPLHVVLAVRLVALLVAAVLQAVPLQVLERGAAGGDTAVTYRVTAAARPAMAAWLPTLSLVPRGDEEVPCVPSTQRQGWDCWDCSPSWGRGAGVAPCSVPLHPKTQHPACTTSQGASARG